MKSLLFHVITSFPNTSSHQRLQRGAAGRNKVKYIENKRKNKTSAPQN